MGFFQGPKLELFGNLDLKIVSSQKAGGESREKKNSSSPEKEDTDREVSFEGGHNEEDSHALLLALYDEYRPRLLRYLGSLQLTRDQAEEVIQETFLRLATELAGGRKIANVQGWIVRVSHNLAIDLRKKTERDAVTNMDLEAVEIQHPLVDPSTGPFENVADEERLDRIDAVLGTLTPTQRQCFEMRVEGFRFKDMAVALGISEQRAALVVKQASVRLAAACR